MWGGTLGGGDEELLLFDDMMRRRSNRRLRRRSPEEVGNSKVGPVGKRRGQSGRWSQKREQDSRSLRLRNQPSPSLKGTMTVFRRLKINGERETERKKGSNSRPLWRIDGRSMRRG